MPDNKGMMGGIVPSGTPIQPNAQEQRSGNTEYNAIPTYLAFIKSVQDGNQAGMAETLKRVAATRGMQTAADLQFLAKSLQGSTIGDIAKRNISYERNPELKRLYHIINENPDVINNFEYFLPKSGGMGSSLAALK